MNLSVGYEKHEHKAASTDADVKLFREKKGQCGECGNILFSFTGVFKGNKVPVNNDFANNGVCLRCHPTKLSGGSTDVGSKSIEVASIHKVTTSPSATNISETVNVPVFKAVDTDKENLISPPALENLPNDHLKVKDLVSLNETEICNLFINI